MLALSGANSYTGATQVEAGSLALTGSLTSDVTVAKEAVLTGNGNITGKLDNSGTLVPGLNSEAQSLMGTHNAIGILNVQGDFTNNGNIMLAANGLANSQIAVIGAAILNSGKILAAPNSYYLPETYTYLTAASITSNMTEQSNEAFSGLLDIAAVENTGTVGNITLKLTEDKSFVGNFSSNQNNSWSGLKNMSVNEALDRTPAAEILAMDRNEAGKVLEQMAGGAQLSMANSIQTSNVVSRAINMRMADISKTVNVQADVNINGLEENDAVAVDVPVTVSTEYSWWFKPVKSWSDVGSSSVKTHSSAMLVGIDREYAPHKRFGMFAGQGNANLSGDSFSIKTKDYRAGIYSLYSKGADEGELYFDYGHQNNEGTRLIGTLTADSDYGSNTIEIGGEYRHDIDYDSDREWHRKTFIGLQTVKYTQGGYQETGSIGILGQQVDKMDSTYTSGRIGMEFAQQNNAKDDIKLRMGYRHDFSGTNPEMQYSFIGDGQKYSVRGNEADKDYLILGANGTHKFNQDWSVNLDVQLEQGRKDQNLTAGITFKKVW